MNVVGIMLLSMWAYVSRDRRLVEKDISPALMPAQLILSRYLKRS